LQAELAPEQKPDMDHAQHETYEEREGEREFDGRDAALVAAKRLTGH
jgi:hypothetical protein